MKLFTDSSYMYDVLSSTLTAKKSMEIIYYIFGRQDILHFFLKRIQGLQVFKIPTNVICTMSLKNRQSEENFTHQPLKFVGVNFGMSWVVQQVIYQMSTAITESKSEQRRKRAGLFKKKNFS